MNMRFKIIQLIKCILVDSDLTVKFLSPLCFDCSQAWLSFASLP